MTMIDVNVNAKCLIAKIDSYWKPTSFHFVYVEAVLIRKITN